MQLGTQKEKRVFSYTWILDLKEYRCFCKKCKDVNSACCLWVLCDAQVLSVSSQLYCEQTIQRVVFRSYQSLERLSPNGQGWVKA